MVECREQQQPAAKESVSSVGAAMRCDRGLKRRHLRCLAGPKRRRKREWKQRDVRLQRSPTEIDRAVAVRQGKAGKQMRKGVFECCLSSRERKNGVASSLLSQIDLLAHVANF
ncbi:unnamed protein product [Lactuca virosa]|uniref:Uncharacterized protein n=1 Tax=Lactuca virosa TaxID=75947 RepID=A0AAU9LI08_9ASTR|nr:unnamed protein product [Lactuca virosa]